MKDKEISDRLDVLRLGSLNCLSKRTRAIVKLKIKKPLDINPVYGNMQNKTRISG